MDIVESILKVLLVGLVLGAGLPALFALGLRFQAAGAGNQNADGTVTAPNPGLRALGITLYVLVAAVIVVGILWITRQTISYYFDLQIFPQWAYN